MCLSDETTLVTTRRLTTTSLNLKQPQREEPQELVDLLNFSVDTLDTEYASVHPSFDMDASIRSDSVGDWADRP